MFPNSGSYEFSFADLRGKRIPGVTSVQIEQHLQACAVCLDHHGHKSGLLLPVNHQSTYDFQLNWDIETDDHIRRGWKDFIEATQYGATAIAIMMVLRLTDYTILERSAIGTGFDYWLLEEEEAAMSFELLPVEGTARLEVSGLLRAENDSQIKARIKKKLTQTKTSDYYGYPAYIAVVEFSRPEAHLVYRK